MALFSNTSRLVVTMTAALIGFLPIAATAQSADNCQADKEALGKINEQIAKLGKTNTPAQVATQLTAVIDELIEGLKGTQKGLKEFTDKVDGAKGKLDTLSKYLKDNGMPVPASLQGLRGALDDFSGSIQKALKDYGKSAPGQVVERPATCDPQAAETLPDERVNIPVLRHTQYPMLSPQLDTTLDI